MNALRVGISGAGPAGLRVVRETRLHDDCRVIAVHDPDLQRAQHLAAASDLGFATDDFTALLDYGVDFVVLTGPLQPRTEQVALAAEQSVPVLLHAPVATSLTAARHIAALAERHEVRVGVLVDGQGDPVVEQLRRMIAADWLGGVVTVQALAADDELLRTGAVQHRIDPFLALSSEHVHLATWLTGRRAVTVSAQTTRSFAPDIDDGGVATVVLRGNIPCTYTASRLSRANAFAIHGTDGGVRISGDRIWLTGQRPFSGHVFAYDSPGIEQVLLRRDLEGALAGQRAGCELHGRFARWLDDTDDFPCPIEQAVLDLEVLDAMARAARDGVTVRLA
ncbi:MAG: Gfo/Idh/MocA family oxidoreductase [Planctomycetes bacterium]|nr:Gfo/Idh/MocA family oxidoreductase [Planctomycetota bacterium]